MNVRPALCALCACLLCATAWAEALAAGRNAGAEGEIVAAVELRFPEGMRIEALADFVSIRPGDRLTRREVRRSIDLIFATGKVADVRALKAQRPDGRVDLAFEIQPRRFIPASQILFQGNAHLSEAELRRAARLGEGRLEYFPENLARLVEAIRASYARVGFNRIAIAHEFVAEADGTGHLTISIDEGAPSRLSAISFAGNPELPTGDLMAAFGLGLGDVLDLDRVKQGIGALRALYRQRGYYQARIGQPDLRFGDAGDAQLLLPISAGLPIEFAFQGNAVFAEHQLKALLRYAGEDRLDEAYREELARRLEEAYRLIGFADARVRADFRFLRAQRRGAVIFTIDEGEVLRVREVSFAGARHLPPEKLREELFELLRQAAAQADESARPNGAFIVGGPGGDRGAAHPLVRPEELYLEPIYRELTERIQARYLADGFLKARVDLPLIERDEARREARASFAIVEGVQTRVAQLDLSEVPEGLTQRGLEEVLTLRIGDPFNPAQLSASKVAIAKALQAKGYLFASVEEAVEIVDGDRSAHLYFRLMPGPRVRLGRIVIQGHERTSENVVRSALDIKEGDILTPQAIQKSQRTLVRLGIFRTARVALEAPDIAEAVKDLTVRLEERKTWFFSVGAGYSLMDGARITAEVGKINLFGQALQLQLQGKLNFLKLSPLPGVRDAQSGLAAIGRKLNLGLVYPHALWLMPLDVTLRTNLLHEYLLRTSYTFQRTAAVLGADLALFSKLSVSLQYEIEEVIVHRLNSAEGANILWIDRERLRFEEGRVYLHSLRPIVRLDFRDNPISPRKGFLLTGQVELVQSLNSPGDEIEPFFFLKLSGQANAYIPLPARAVLALSLAAGKVFPLDADGSSRTIVPKRFFVGGAGSLRGFMDDGLVPEDQRRAIHRELAECALKGTCESLGNYTSEGGELFTLARAELRIPILGQFELAVFFDAGNLWLDQQRFNPLALRYAAGVGLRMLTPIGPAALDLGINLNPDEALGESRFVPHFSIGLF